MGKNQNLIWYITMILRIILFSCSITTSLAFCNEAKYLHPQEEAGSACYKEDEGIICDTNKDSLCTQENCEIQFGSFDPYTCAIADFYYDESPDKFGELLGDWTKKCCFDDPPQINGCLSGVVAEFTGECTYDNVIQATGEKGCSEENMFPYLEAGNLTEAKKAIEFLCDSAFSTHVDSFYDFNDISKGGYQFDREFMNGGSEWNNAFNPDMSRIQWMEDNIVTKGGIRFPEYLHNFDTDNSCESKAVMCCWIADSTEAGEGSCTDSGGCQDEEPVDNTDVCYVNIENSPLASHTASGIALLPGESEGPANCMGFTWEENTISGLYKGNLLFEVAMRYGLKDNGYTRSVPHAPMCACVEQMPVVSNADCRDISKISHSFFLTSVEESGSRSIVYNGPRIQFGDCDGKDLATHYESVHSKISTNPVKDGCAEVEGMFLLGKGYAKQQDVKWIQVAGKGAHSDPTFSLQVHDGQISHSSMTREEFKELWEKSTKVLLRRCDTCDMLHRQIYYKRHDEGELPSNVDILHDFKEHWTAYENNVWQEDFDLYSSYSNAIKDKHAWKAVDMNSTAGIGCCGNSGPVSASENQWNVWDTPLSEGGNKYGQRNIGLYVAMSTGLRSFSSPTTVPTSSMIPSSHPTSSFSPSIKLYHLINKGGNPAETLGRCEGDCDDDSHCAEGLHCFQRSGHTAVPGCVGGFSGDKKNYDYCVPKDPNAFYLDTKGGNPKEILGRCEGDCDYDYHCAAGLKCFQRSD